MEKTVFLFATDTIAKGLAQKKKHEINPFTDIEFIFDNVLI